MSVGSTVEMVVRNRSSVIPRIQTFELQRMFVCCTKQDLNLLHPASKADALPNELFARLFALLDERPSAGLWSRTTSL